MADDTGVWEGVQPSLFSGSPIDRHNNQRKHELHLDSMRKHEQAQMLVFVDTKLWHNSSAPGLTWKTFDDKALPQQHLEEVYLGCMPAAEGDSLM